jgi:IS605 OrfB family transposase
MYLAEYGKFFGVLERKLFAESHAKGISPATLKKSFQRQFGITARQFNAIRMQLDGKVSSIKEKRAWDQEELESKINFLQKKIEQKEKQKQKQWKALQKMKQTDIKFQKQIKKYRNSKFYLHQKKRRLRNLQQKLEKLKIDEKANRIRICFGSKKLFHKPFYLEENGYSSVEEWKQDWIEARSTQFLVVGSKDETFGNQTAVYDLQNNLRLRVADHFISKYGKYITFTNVTFPYGQKQLEQAKEVYHGFTSGGKPQKYYQSITYRFIKKEKGWYLNATTKVETPETGTSNDNGLIGIDLNAGFLSICEVDRFGNPLKEWKIRTPMYGRTKEQIKASLSDAIKEVVEYAILPQKNIVIEKLNFSKKKTQLREIGSKQARMLSGFAYSTFKRMMESKVKKAGVYLQFANPAYTSQIGHMKFMARYGLSSHGSAACMIARRGYRFKTEKPKYDTILTLPKKFNKEKSNYSNWRSMTNHFKKSYFFHDKIELLKADR